MLSGWQRELLVLASKIRKYLKDELTMNRENFDPKEGEIYQFNFLGGDAPVIKYFVDGSEVYESIVSLRLEDEGVFFIEEGGREYYESELNLHNLSVIADAFDMAMANQRYTEECE